MITLFTRKELTVTYSMNERVRICDILSANGIDYTTKTTNTTASGFGNSRRGGSTPGIHMDYAYEYKIYVHKKDYEHAVHLMHHK